MIAGVSIDALTWAESEALVQRYLDEEHFHRIATVNPEFLVLASRSSTFREAIQSADARLLDGVGIKLAYWLRGESAPARIAGADLLERILSLAEERKMKVFLLLARDGLSTGEEICAALQFKYPMLSVDFMLLDRHGNDSSVPHPSQDAEIVLSNLGAPAQEIVLAKLKEKPQHIRLAMGVGGALDYLTRKKWRAPIFLRCSGLEWLWRLVLQPGRARRIIRSVVVFPLLLFFGRMKP